MAFEMPFIIHFLSFVLDEMCGQSAIWNMSQIFECTAGSGVSDCTPIALYICVLHSRVCCPHIPAYAKSAILGTWYVLCVQDVARAD